MIPIIYNIPNDIEKLEISLSSIKDSDIENGYLILIDNLNENIKNDFNFSKYTIFQPEEKMTNIQLFKFSIMIGFNLFKTVNKIVVLNDSFVFHKKWFLFLNRMFINEFSENIGIASSFNNDPIIENIDEEPFFIDGKINLKSFMMTRRLFNNLNSNDFFNDDENMNFNYSSFKSIKTSYSFMKRIGTNCDRFL